LDAQNHFATKSANGGRPTSMSSISGALAAGTIVLVAVQTLRHRRQPGECERSAQRLFHHQNLTLSNTMGPVNRFVPL
jgi:hypothetical protein